MALDDVGITIAVNRDHYGKPTTNVMVDMCIVAPNGDCLTIWHQPRYHHPGVSYYSPYDIQGEVIRDFVRSHL